MNASTVEARHLAHARRACYDIDQATQSPIAAEAIELIAALYQIEPEIRGRTHSGR